MVYTVCGLANSVDHDHIAPQGPSDLGLHCLPRPVCLKTGKYFGIFYIFYFCTAMNKRNRTSQLPSGDVFEGSFKSTRPAADKAARFLCSECGGCYRSMTILKQHTRIHQENKFLCPICARQFTRKNRYTEHINSHSGIQPYSCSSCGKSFSHRNSFMAHRCRGAREAIKLFMCEVCSLSYTNRGSLSHHIAANHGDEIFACTCGKTFKFKINLHRHKKSKNH